MEKVYIQSSTNFKETYQNLDWMQIQIKSADTGFLAFFMSVLNNKTEGS